MSLKNNIQGSNDARLENANSENAILRSSVSDSDIPFVGARDGQSTIYSLPTYPEPGKVSIEIDGNFVDHPTYGNIINPFEFIRVYPTIPNADFVDIKITNTPVYIAAPDRTQIVGLVVRGDAAKISIADKASWVFFQQEKPEFNYPVELFAGDITSSSANLTWVDSTPYRLARKYQVMWRAFGTDVWSFSSVIATDKYSIVGLTPKTTYEWSVMSYFKDMRDFSRYSQTMTFTTR